MILHCSNPKILFYKVYSDVPYYALFVCFEKHEFFIIKWFEVKLQHLIQRTTLSIFASLPKHLQKLTNCIFIAMNPFQEFFHNCPDELQQKLMFHLALKGRVEAHGVIMWLEINNKLLYFLIFFNIITYYIN